VARFPELAPRAKARERRDLALVFLQDGKLLVGRRRDDAVWGGLWELPRVTLLENEPLADAARRLGREVLGTGATLAGSAELARVRHTVMNERIELRVLPGALKGEPEPRGHAELRWIAAAERAGLPWPSPQKKALGAIFATSESPRPDR
jgi:adenine-specific DNA glycosylase